MEKLIVKLKEYIFVYTVFIPGFVIFCTNYDFFKGTESAESFSGMILYLYGTIAVLMCTPGNIAITLFLVYFICAGAVELVKRLFKKIRKKYYESKRV